MQCNVRLLSRDVVCNTRALWPNGWTDQDETWHACWSRPWPHYVIDGNPAPPPPKGHSPLQFLAHICCGQMAAWIKMSLGMEQGLGPGHTVLDGDQLPLPKRAQPPIFGPCLMWPNGWMDQDAMTWYDGRPRPWQHCVRCGPSSNPQGAQPPNFGSCLISRLAFCITDLAESYSALRLQLNPSKTEPIWFGTRCNLNKIPHKHLSLSMHRLSSNATPLYATLAFYYP